MIKENNVILQIIRTLFTFALVCVGWVFFRANTVGDALFVLGQMLTPGIFDPFSLGLSTPMLNAVIAAAIVLFVVDFFNRRQQITRFVNSHTAVRYVVYFVILLSIVQYESYKIPPY